MACTARMYQKTNAPPAAMLGFSFTRTGTHRPTSCMISGEVLCEHAAHHVRHQGTTGPLASRCGTWGEGPLACPIRCRVRHTHIRTRDANLIVQNMHVRCPCDHTCKSGPVSAGTRRTRSTCGSCVHLLCEAWRLAATRPHHAMGSSCTAVIPVRLPPSRPVSTIPDLCLASASSPVHLHQVSR